MRSHVVKFTENTIVLMAIISIVFALALGFFFDYIVVGSALAIYAGAYAIRSLGAEVTVTRTFLTRKNLFGESRIAWDEMDLVEVTGDDFWFVFHGRDGRISMPGPVSSLESRLRWETEEDYQDERASLLLDLAEEHGVPITGNWFAPFKLSRG